MKVIISLMLIRDPFSVEASATSFHASYSFGTTVDDKNFCVFSRAQSYRVFSYTQLDSEFLADC